MRIIIKTGLAAIVFLIAISVNAQDKPLTFGIKAGMNISNFSGDGVDDSDARIGFNAGVTLDITLTPDVYLLTGLEFTTKGAKTKGLVNATDASGALIEGSGKCNPMYLQLPLHIGYKIGTLGDMRFVVHTGPYIAYGIAGSYKVDGKAAGMESIDTDIFSSAFFKKFDMGLGFGVGAEFGKICTAINCDFGLINISKMEGEKIRNMSVAISVGYKF
ncbi:PorT family protein [Dysgonomonas sp. 521]|uniref:porin family protein n=1 Tax=Dysgonomonas sp. 521 TaxID=2302932 RepID=UPI0013D34A9D|nr:porin family protein [Dysgonomonas sp. 521]NDV96978.1 PorT family protein [Dysgonomonas sp. 521]